MNNLFQKAFIGTAVFGSVIGKNLVETLEGNPKLNSLRSNCNEQLAELKKVISSQKDYMHRDKYFNYKSECSSIESLFTRVKSEKEIKALIEKIKKYIAEVKKFKK